MYVKSLTLKGFKSFASATHMRLEPGITCIVGPNGSGKSNVVDALAWVMGEQGAKNLRGGKMEDVIFAGTSTRGPLGRAEVQLTIDNADGALPIEYSEVTISRTLFRNGTSEYAINGDSCRLLDVQELLSDSGLGREMHVIVGQGRLDSVLQASPEDRRGFIEEAAGILKHRRRKEKTLRKLEAMEANLTRLSDLAGELRRQLKPLGKQAEIAREAATIAAVVRDAKARLFADDLVGLRAQLADHARNEQERHAERLVLQDQVEQLKLRIDALEAQQRSEAVDAARSTAFALERVRRAGIPAEHVDPSAFEDREGFDRELADRVASHDVGLVVGAGYMRVLSRAFLGRFPAVLNVHPSLLPEFRGLRAVERALEATGGASSGEVKDAVAEFMALYEASPVEGTVLYPGAAACLDALSGAGIRLGICTNKPEAVSRLLVGGLGLLDRFGALVGGDSCAVRKPAAEPALEACRRLGVDPARTWFVGDSEHDVACGRSAGCSATILVTYGYLRVPVEEIEADALAGDLGEVARLALSASG